MLVLPRAERPFAKGPFFAFLVTVVATERWRADTLFEGGFDPVVISKAALSVVGALLAWWLVRNRERRPVVAWPFILMTLYLGCTIFGGWASHDLMASVVVAIRIAILMFSVCLLLRGYDGYSVMAGLVGALATVGTFSVLTGSFTDGRLVGGLPPLHPNEIASICATVILWLLYRAVNGRENGLDLVALVTAVGILLATGSRTSLVMLLPSALILLLSARRFHVRTLVPFLLFLPLCAIGLTMTDAISGVLTREGNADNVLSLSNRTIAWQAAFTPNADPWRTWFGGGLALKEIEVPGQWWSHQILDSSWVSALVQGGYLGFALCLAMVLYGLIRIAGTRGELRGFRLALVVFLALRGVMESGLFDASAAFLGLFTALAMPDAVRPLPPAGIRSPAASQFAANLRRPEVTPTSGGSMYGSKRRLFAAACLLMVGLAVSAVVNVFAPRMYVSTASLYAAATGEQSRATEIYQGTMMVSARMSTYVELATSPVILNEVISELSLPETAAQLAERVTATNPAGNLGVADISR